MSAFVLEKAHIDVLANAAVQAGLVKAGPDAASFGLELWTENYASVNYRYQETEQVPDYTLTEIAETISPAVVVKAVACYDYQSCEHPAWNESRCRLEVDMLRSVASAQNPRPSEIEAAPYNIDTLEDAGLTAK